jgi:hypothetical protein
MPKLNPYLVKEITKLPETATVSYFDEVEWNKSLTAEQLKQQQSLNEIYEDEWQDKVLHDPQYGPGSNQSSYSDNSDRARRERYAAKTTMGMGSTIVLKAAGPVGSVVSGVVGVAATTVGEIGHALSSSSEAKDAWKYTSELGQNMMIGALGGGLVEGTLGKVFENSNCDLIREGWELWNERGGEREFYTNYHEFHRARGEDYSSWCDVCKS